MIALLDNSFDCFSKTIIDNLNIGLVGIKPTCYLDYKGDYYKEKYTSTSKKYSKLLEIIEDVINEKWTSSFGGEMDKEYKFLVTRQVGTDNFDRWKPNTRISLIHESEGKIFLWVPTFKEIFGMFKKTIDRHDGRYHIGNLKLLNDKLAISSNFSIAKVITTHYDDVSGVYRDIFDDYIPYTALYSLLKEILISEDIRYKGSEKFGHYLTLTALIDFINSDKPFEEIKSQYNLPN